jgi:anaerobic magnesium-protoporphyrin IX monomethyl ester cyclase
MKVLFVNVVNPDNSVHTRYYPLGFGYLKSYAEKHGVHFESYYTELPNNSYLQRLKPDVVCFSCITELYPLACKYASMIKQVLPSVKTLIGGVHISAVPDSLTKDFDVGVIGEGEQTFLLLAQNNFTPSQSIDGLVYWQHGTLRRTKQRELIEPLDSIPHPDRTIYNTQSDKTPYLFTSRGCPYSCIFCSSTRFWRKVRLHSAQYVAEEIWSLYNQGVRHVNIYDDTFLISLGRVKELKTLTPKNMTYTIAARANQLTDTTCKVLKELGVTQVGVGMESYSNRILMLLEKGNTASDNLNAVRNLKKYDIKLSASFICGVPGETSEDLKKTFDFIRTYNISYDMYKLMRYPNTPLYMGSTDWASCRVQYYYTPVQKVKRLIRKVIRH